MKLKFLFTLLIGSLTAGIISAACPVKNETPLTSLTAGFDAWKVVTSAMEECGNFKPELDQDFRLKQPAAFAANPSQYAIGGVANSTLIPLMNDNSIRPLDDLISKYGKDIQENQKIKKDGKTMAIAMMINAQHLMYRNDILQELNIPVPSSYKEVLEAAETIKKSGLVEYPLTGTYKSGWNLAQEFVNLYLGFGGKFFDGNQPNINNSEGVATLRMMRDLSAYMDPEFLTFDSTVVQKQFQQGKVAMANLWASRAGAMNDEQESMVVGKIGFAAAPIAKDGMPPATTLWWDGMVLARNISDQEAEAAFKLMMYGISGDVLSQNKDAAIWLTNAFGPSDIAKGAVDSAKAGAPPYPASTAFGLMHTALGNNLADFLTGKESAKQALIDTEAEYIKAAREAGLL